jgi:hypothetical protein
LAVLAVGVAGYAAWQVQTQDERLGRLEQGVRDVQGGVTSLEARLDATLGGRFAQPDAMVATRRAEGAPDESGVDGGLATRAPATPQERLAALEATVATQRDTIAELKKEADAERSARSTAQRGMNERFYFDLDSAAKSLGLSERQKADMGDLIEAGKRDLADLYAIPSDDGVTWADLRKPIRASVGGDGGGLTFSMPDFQKIEKLKRSRIPGSSETFGQAEERIKERSFGEMRNLLTPEQTKKWDQAHKDNLLGAGGGGASIAFVSGVVTEGEDK